MTVQRIELRICISVKLLAIGRMDSTTFYMSFFVIEQGRDMTFEGITH